MNYRIFIIFCFFILVIGCEKEKETTLSKLNYVPNNASTILKINNFQSFQESLEINNFLANLISSKSYTHIGNKINALKYLNPKSESILVFSESKSTNFEFTLITNNHQNLIDTLASQKISSKQFNYKNTTHNKHEIEGTIFYSSIYDHTIVITTSKIVLKNITDNLGVERKLPILEKLYKIADDTKPVSALIHLDRKNPLIFPLIKNSSLISKFSDWALFDFDCTKNNITLNGLSIANDSLKNYLNLFKNTIPLTNSTASFAPINTDAILSYTIDNHYIFTKNQKEFSEHSYPIDSLLNTVKEIGLMYFNNKTAIIINTYDAENISEYLTGIKQSNFDYQGNEILELSEVNFLNKRLHPIIKKYNTNFCTIIEDAFVFTDNIESLQTIIRNFKNGSTYNKSTVYKLAMKKLAGESTVLFVSNSKKIKHILKQHFSENFYKDIEENFTERYSYAAQTIADQNFYHTNIVIQKIEKENDIKKVSPLYSIKLAAEIANEPQFITNHLTGKKEIVVQDQNNILYLISEKGKILWKKQLAAGIQGKIKQVDIFKNGRLQLAFTTNNQFLVLDRNGKEVTQFTKTFDGGNLNELAVFDYDGKKDYRFVVTQAEKIFMYNSKATIVNGFKYSKAVQPILSAPKHIRIGKKDFIVFKLEGGHLKIVNRRGADRIKLNEKIDFSENEIFLYQNQFTLTDKKGLLYQIDTKGKITKTNLNLSHDHGLYATSKTLAVMNDNILNIRKKKVELELGVYTQPKIFYIYDKLYITVTDLQHQKIYLFDSQAKPISNFPIIGASIIDLNDINNDKKLELVTKDKKNSLRIYQIN